MRQRRCGRGGWWVQMRGPSRLNIKILEASRPAVGGRARKKIFSIYLYKEFIWLFKWYTVVASLVVMYVHLLVIMVQQIVFLTLKHTGRKCMKSTFFLVASIATEHKHKRTIFA